MRRGKEGGKNRKHEVNLEEGKDESDRSSHLLWLVWQGVWERFTWSADVSAFLSFGLWCFEVSLTWKCLSYFVGVNMSVNLSVFSFLMFFTYFKVSLGWLNKLFAWISWNVSQICKDHTVFYSKNITKYIYLAYFYLTFSYFITYFRHLI